MYEKRRRKSRYVCFVFYRRQCTMPPSTAGQNGEDASLVVETPEKK